MGISWGEGIFSGSAHYNLCLSKEQAPVVQRPDNFIQWIRHYSGSKIDFILNVVLDFLTLPNLAVVSVHIHLYKRKY